MCLLYSLKLCSCSISLIVFLLVRNTYCSLLPMSLKPYTVYQYFPRQPPLAQNIIRYPNIYPQTQALPPPPPQSPNFCLIALVQSVISYVSSTLANQNSVQYQSSSNTDYYQSSSSIDTNSNYNSYNTQYTSPSDSVDYSFLEEDYGSNSNYAEPVLVTQEEDSNTNYSEPELISNGGKNRISQNLIRRKRETRTEVSDVKYGLIAGSMLAFQAVALAAFGQPMISKSGVVKLWDGDIYGSENSQQVMDWYTFSHVVHGLILYEILDAIDPSLPLELRLVVSMSIEVIWEVLENTPFLIERYRQTAVAQGYVGDSILNSISDTVAMAIGFLMAEKLHWTAVLALIFAEELIVGYSIRDNLALNIINFVHPVDWITEWQAQGRPKRSKLK